jgi:hypothetical protein
MHYARLSWYSREQVCFIAVSSLYSAVRRQSTDLIPDIYMTMEVNYGCKRPSYSGPDHES